MENIEFGGNKIPMRLVRVGFLNESNLDIGSKEKVPDKVEDFEGRE